MIHHCFRPGKQFQTEIAIETTVWGIGIVISNYPDLWHLVQAGITLHLLCLSIETWFFIRRPYWWDITRKETQEND